MKVTEASSWEEVQRATDAAETCIAPIGKRNWLGANHDRARETWEKHREIVRYFVFGEGGTEGYARIIRVNQAAYQHPTWITDFLQPFKYGEILLVAPLVGGTLLVKGFGQDKQTVNWPRFTAAFPILKNLPYAAQSSEEGVWLVVPRPELS